MASIATHRQKQTFWIKVKEEPPLQVDSSDWLHRFSNFPGSFTVRLGYEYAQNFGFVAGDHRHHVLGEVGWKVDLDSLIH